MKKLWMVEKAGRKTQMRHEVEFIVATPIRWVANFGRSLAQLHTVS